MQCHHFVLALAWSCVMGRFLLMTSILAVLGLTGCQDEMAKSGANASQELPPTTVGVAIARNDANSPFLQKMYDTAKKTGENTPNITLFVEEAKGDLQIQYTQLDKMLADGAKALIINIADTDRHIEDVTAEIVSKYCDKVPLVFYNTRIGEKAMASCPNAYMVLSDTAQGAITQGLTVLEHWQKNPAWDKNADGKIQLALMDALPPDADGIKGRGDWTLSTIQSYPTLGKDIEVLFRGVGIFQTHLAEEAVNEWVKSPEFANVELIVASSDSMAYGVANVLKQNNLKLPIFGLDGLPQTAQAIKDGDLVASVGIDFEKEMEVAVRLAANLANKQDPLATLDYRMENRVMKIPYKLQ